MAFFKKKKKGKIDFSIGDIKIIQNILMQVATMKKKERKIVSIFGIAALFVFVLLIAAIIYKSPTSKTINLDPTDTISALTTNIADNIVTPIEKRNPITNTPRPTNTLVPTDTTPVSTPQEEIEPWAQLIIEVNKKKDTLDVLEGINESNLDKCVGYMPGSALPGETGLCIFMGHRDTDFRILNKATIGDRITVVYDGKSYVYEIDKIEILSNQSQIDYEIRNIPSIALVTCYPFNYIGSAPQQCVLYASLIS